MRNLDMHIERGRVITTKRPGLQLSSRELLGIITRNQEDFVKNTNPIDMGWNAVCQAYLIGLSIGMKNANR